MSIRFSQQPGIHERQLKRRANNPLFPVDKREVTQAEIIQAQRRDSQEVADFLDQFRLLVQRAVELKPQEDSEVVLKLKEELDQAYERCCGLAGDQTELKAAIRKLLQLVMQAVWRGAETDPAAQANLRDEEIARNTHFQLLEQPLIADLLRPDSPIEQDELAPTLLSESEAGLRAALGLFDPDQLGLLIDSARQIVAKLPEDSPQHAPAAKKLTLLLEHQQMVMDDSIISPS